MRVTPLEPRFGSEVAHAAAGLSRAEANGRLVSPVAALDLTLQNADTVALIPAYSGG